jgi:hypothetical protein
MRCLEIPTFSYAEALEGRGQKQALQLGKSVPMLAITGVPVENFSGVLTGNPDAEYSKEHDHSYTRIGAEHSDRFTDVVVPLLQTCMRATVAPYDYDRDDDSFFPVARPYLFASHTQPWAGESRFVGHDLGMHVDRKYTDASVTTYGVHLTIEGTSRVLARRACVGRTQDGPKGPFAWYENDPVREQLYERQAGTGDLHVFVRRSTETKNTHLGRRVVSASFHSFVSTSPTRTFIETTYVCV